MKGSMVEYYDGTCCVSRNFLVNEGIMSASNYKQLVARGQMKSIRKAHGRGNYALIALDSIPDRYQAKIKMLVPNLGEGKLEAWIVSHYTEDTAARNYFYDRGQCGQELPAAKAWEYTINASVLNTCIALYDNVKEYRRLMGQDYDWGRMAAAIEILRNHYRHTLPASVLRFRKKVAEYRRGGYPTLMSGKFGNSNARIMTALEEEAVLSIAAQPNKPWNKNVREMYEMFVCGELDVYHMGTGELLDPDKYATGRDGEPWVPSESTIANFLNRPDISVLLSKAHDDRETFMHEQRPHVHRHDGQYSLSQITADDVDLTRKLRDTRKRVHAYYMYDDLSQCVIGAAYSRKKDQGLITECFRDMYRTIARHGWGMPAGIEVENHLMSEHRDGFLQAGVAFSFVRFCAPLNSQEKRAESLNGAKKRSVIHKNHAHIGRFYGKGKMRVKGRKVSDADNDTWEDAAYYSYEQLVAEDMADNREWNNSLHPNQKKYPGKTRWQVLEENINPDLEPLDALTLCRYLGEAVSTSVRRNSTVRVDNREWWLSGPEVLEKLAPNDYKVTAYFLPKEDGTVEDVYIFQNDRLIDKVEPVRTFCRVMAEQTDEDRAIFEDQQKRIAKFDSYVERRAIPKVGITPRKPIAAPVEEVVVPVLQPSDDAASQDGAWYLDYLPAEDQRARGREAL